MAGLGRILMSVTALAKNLTEATSRPMYMVCRSKFTRSRIPPQEKPLWENWWHSLYFNRCYKCFDCKVFEERCKEHEVYGGDPEQPHKLHIVTRVKSTKRRPYWEKKVVKSLGLLKSHEPRVHKNTPSVNNQLKIIKHLIRIQPLKLPNGLPSEEEMAGSYLNSKGELVIKRLQTSEVQKTVES